MTARFKVRQSRAATWSARLGALSIPVLAITVIGRQFDQLAMVETFALLAVTWTIAAVAVALGVVAAIAIWRDGLAGAGAAVKGLVMGGAIL